MSGGSYDYLCFKDATDIHAMHEQLQQMAERLAGLGYAPDAAQETWNVLHTLRQQEALIASYLQRLTGVWHAVEWWDSADSGEAQVKHALWEYRGKLEHDHTWVPVYPWHAPKHTWWQCSACGKEEKCEPPAAVHP